MYWKSLFSPGVVHLGQIQSGLRAAIRIVQGSHIKIHMNSDVPVQVDGEPWIQPAGDIVVLRSALKVCVILDFRSHFTINIFHKNTVFLKVSQLSLTDYLRFLDFCHLLQFIIIQLLFHSMPVSGLTAILSYACHFCWVFNLDVYQTIRKKLLNE